MFPHRALIVAVALLMPPGAEVASSNEESAEGLKPGAVRTNPKDGLAYVWIPPGQFEMGCVPGDDECQIDEDPRHTVNLTKGFWMGQTEVTVKAFERFTRKSAVKMPPKPLATKFGGLSRGAKGIADRFQEGPGKKEDHPVVNVLWSEAQAYCEYAGGRLPTEAEWEYAARAGQDGQKYPWGDEISHEYANYGNVSGRDQWAYTAPVASFPANDFGLHDMVGNVWEWCSDWLDGNYYRRSPPADPPGPTSGEERAVRGGSWGFHPEWLRTSVRVRAIPDGRGDDIGLRCVLDSAR
jgi:formylglycine-generating enzyme required for sulfatase activity